MGTDPPESHRRLGAQTPCPATDPSFPGWLRALSLPACLGQSLCLSPRCGPLLAFPPPPCSSTGRRPGGRSLSPLGVLQVDPPRPPPACISHSLLLSRHLPAERPQAPPLWSSSSLGGLLPAGPGPLLCPRPPHPCPHCLLRSQAILSKAVLNSQTVLLSATPPPPRLPCVPASLLRPPRQLSDPSSVMDHITVSSAFPTLFPVVRVDIFC